MERVIASGRELPVYVQEILNARYLGGNDYAVMSEPISSAINAERSALWIIASM